MLRGRCQLQVILDRKHADFIGSFDVPLRDIVEDPEACVASSLTNGPLKDQGIIFVSATFPAAKVVSYLSLNPMLDFLASYCLPPSPRRARLARAPPLPQFSLSLSLSLSLSPSIYLYMYMDMYVSRENI